MKLPLPPRLSLLAIESLRRCELGIVAPLLANADDPGGVVPPEDPEGPCSPVEGGIDAGAVPRVCEAIEGGCAIALDVRPCEGKGMGSECECDCC